MLPRARSFLEFGEMEVNARKEGYQIPQVEFVFRENGEFVTRTSADLFDGKRVVIFSLPGAFTPTCSAYQLPEIGRAHV